MNCSCCEEPVTFVHAKDKTGQIAIRPCTKNNRPPCQIRRDPLVGSAFRRDALVASVMSCLIIDPASSGMTSMPLHFACRLFHKIKRAHKQANHC